MAERKQTEAAQLEGKMDEMERAMMDLEQRCVCVCVLCVLVVFKEVF